MRIATWNLDRARRINVPGLQAQIAQINADIWVLTETNDETLDLSPTHPHLVSTVPVVGLHSRGERWTTIWSRYPTDPVATYDPHVAACCRVAAPLGSLLMYGTVLPWHADKGETGDAKAWTEFTRVLRLQQADWERLSPVCSRDSKERFCLAGDFNQSLDGRLWGGREYYGSKSLRAALSCSLAAVDLECVTKHDLVAAGHLTTRSSIDHICLCAASVAEVQIVSAWEAGLRKNGKAITDHNGVYVDLPG